MQRDGTATVGDGIGVGLGSAIGTGAATGPAERRPTVRHRHRLTARELGLNGADPRGRTYLTSGGGNLYPRGRTYD